MGGNLKENSSMHHEGYSRHARWQENLLIYWEHTFRKHADIGPSVDAQLAAGLEARNHVIHRFAIDVGDELLNGQNLDFHRKEPHEKCALILGPAQK